MPFRFSKPRKSQTSGVLAVRLAYFHLVSYSVNLPKYTPSLASPTSNMIKKTLHILSPNCRPMAKPYHFSHHL